jgi:AcrR family transcriptional regulator
MPNHRGEDRRVRRTKGQLRHAITSLFHEKPYDAIAVKEILTRADVGRTAFYTHFRDKDELLGSAFREALRAGSPRPAARSIAADDVARLLLRFSLPLFERIVHVRQTGHSLETVTRSDEIHGRLRAVLEEHLRDDLRDMPRLSGDRRTPADVELLVRHVAGTFLLVLEWWAEHGDARSARELDARFHALVEPALATALSAPPGR